MELDKPLNQSLQSGSEKVSYTSSNRPSKKHYGTLEVNLKTCTKGTKWRVYNMLFQFVFDFLESHISEASKLVLS